MTGRHRASDRDVPGGTRTRGSSRRGRAVLWVAACLLVLAMAVVLVVRGPLTTADTTSPAGNNPASSSPAIGTCASHETIRVTAAPGVASALRKAAGAWASRSLPDRVCPVVQVTGRASSETVDQLGRRDVDLPDVWVADSSQWVQQLRRDTNGESSPVHSAWVSPSIASSPLVLATSPAAMRTRVKQAAGGWSNVLAGPASISTMDPVHSTEGLLTLATAQAALGGTSGPPSRALVTSLVGLSTHVLRRASDQVESSAATAPAFPTSEQTVIRADSGPGTHRLRAVHPSGRGMSLDFPVVQFVPPTQSSVRRQAVSAFVASLYDAATQRRLRAAGLRDAGGRAFAPELGFQQIAPTATIRSLPQVNDQQITDARRVWSAAQRRNRTLIVVDVSGSMLQQGGAKIRFAAAAAKDAVGYLPDDAELGLWAFSSKLDGATPWRQLVSVGPLGSPADRQARRQRLRSQTDQLPRLAQSRGNTELYATTWHAFRTVSRGFDPRRYNSVVLVTDGRNTGSGFGLNALLSRLRSAKAWSRPVPVFTVAIGPDADKGALTAISAATGGSEQSVDTVSDIREVFLDAVIKEGS